MLVSTFFIDLVVVFMPHGDITVPEDVGWFTVCAGALQSPQQVLERSVTFSISFKDGTAISKHNSNK